MGVNPCNINRGLIFLCVVFAAVEIYEFPNKTNTKYPSLLFCLRTPGVCFCNGDCANSQGRDDRLPLVEADAHAFWIFQGGRDRVLKKTYTAPKLNKFAKERSRKHLDVTSYHGLIFFETIFININVKIRVCWSSTYFLIYPLAFSLNQYCARVTKNLSR